jgi:RNase P subunit RPR2
MHPAITQATAQTRIEDLRRTAEARRRVANGRERRYVAVARLLARTSRSHAPSPGQPAVA